jgi:hypothetical protein
LGLTLTEIVFIRPAGGGARKDNTQTQELRRLVMCLAWHSGRLQESGGRRTAARRQPNYHVVSAECKTDRLLATSNTVPSSNAAVALPDKTRPTCSTWQRVAPTLGPTCSLHFHPGS